MIFWFKTICSWPTDKPYLQKIWWIVCSRWIYGWALIRDDRCALGRSDRDGMVLVSIRYSIISIRFFTLQGSFVNISRNSSSKDEKKKTSMMLLRTCITLFFLWSLKLDILWNVHAALFHTMKVDGDWSFFFYSEMPKITIKYDQIVHMTSLMWRMNWNWSRFSLAVFPVSKISDNSSHKGIN